MATPAENEPVNLPQISVHWGGKKVVIRPIRSHYLTNYSTAIKADAEVGDLGEEPYGTVSVNMFDAPSPGCIWVKTWGENEGLLEQLEEQGLLERTGRTCKSGYVEAPEARLTGDWAMA